MREQLFEPAGMRSSTYVGDEKDAALAAYGHVEGRVAADQGWRDVLKITSAYAKKWGKPLRDWRQEDWVRVGAEQSPNKPAPARVRFENAAASLLCTPADYARFVALLCARPSRASWEITEATRRSMVSRQIAVQDGVPLWWGLGVAIERSSDGWRISHEGNNDNRFTSYFGADPDRRRGLVVMTNCGSGFGVYQRIVRSATGLDQLTFISDDSPPHPA
jgi:CubicO group peptidase (beta-lactamase class C family)